MKLLAYLYEDIYIYPEERIILFTAHDKNVILLPLHAFFRDTIQDLSRIFKTQVRLKELGLLM